MQKILHCRNSSQNPIAKSKQKERGENLYPLTHIHDIQLKND